MRVTVRQRPDREHLQLAYVCPLSGRTKTRSAGTADWDQAQREAAKWESQLAAYRGTDCDWQAFRTRFEDEYLPDVRKGTATQYCSALNHFERLIGSVKSIRAIDANVCSQFSAKLRDKKLSVQTIAKTLRHLRAALRWAESVGIIDRAPRVTVPKLGKHRQSKGRPVTETEFGNILQAVPEGPWRLAWQRFLRGLWLSGLRVGEAVALSWEPGPVYLDMAGEIPAIQFAAGSQKANRSERVPVTPDFAELLLETPAAARSGKVFPLPIVHRDNVSRAIAEFGQLAGIRVGPNKFASAHDLRRSFGTRWALRVHPMTLRAIMRHANIQTTLAYYVDLDTDRITADLYTSMYTASNQNQQLPSGEPSKTRPK